MIKNKVLVLPSWYATLEAPTSGSFFKEQAELMLPEFDIKVLVADKRWISKKRYYFEKCFSPFNRELGSHFIQTPPSFYFDYDFIKTFSDEKNLEIQLFNYEKILTKFITEENWKPDLIHAHCTYTGGIIAAYLSKKFKIPYCITEHIGPFNFNNYSAFWKKKIINALETANEVLAVSNHQKQHILMNEINCNPISVGNLVNENLFSINKSYPEIFTILFVAYYPNFIKDIDTFFKAISLIKNENIKVKIIGGGELKGTLGDNPFFVKAQEYDILEIIDIIPKATRKEMNEIYAKSHLLVSSSIAESFGVAMCEAMLCGRPVVTTRNGGCDEFMIEDLNGHLVPIRNPNALAEKIIYVKDNYPEYNSEKIRESIVSRFGNNIFKERISSLYEKTIKNA